MLQRATTGIYAPGRLVNWRRGLAAGPTSVLLRYLAVVAILTAIGCLYVWETNTLRQLQLGTARLRDARVGLEQTNVNLVNQLAQWNTPAYVDGRAQAGEYAAPAAYAQVDDGAPLIASSGGGSQ